MIESNLLTAATDGFDAAGRAVLQFLHKRLQFDLWMVTRTEGEDWIVLQVEDNGYSVKSETVFRWADSFCSQMVIGRGPRIAPKSSDVSAYAEAPIGQQVPIGAYIGVPLTYTDGSLFGTLCAIHPEPQPSSITAELPLIELLAGMLSGVLTAELSTLAAVRRAERAEADAETDAMTTLYNRRGWNRLLRAEEARCRRYGHPACVIAIDLDGLKTVNDGQGHAAGDELICRAAQAIRTSIREADVLARVGGDEFVVLGAECNLANSRQLLKRIRDTLSDAGVAASLGLSMRVPAKGLHEAWEEADQAMYREKMSRGSGRGGLAIVA